MCTCPRRLFDSRRLLAALCLSLALALSCSAPVERPIGPAGDYLDAKDMFKRSNFNRTLEFTDGLATASPPTKYTERALVLRCIIYAGEVESYKELAEAYERGADQTKNSHFKAEYGRQRHDNLQYGTRAALGLADAAHRLTLAGGIPKEVPLEAPYPTTEAPIEIRELMRVKEGGWIEPEQQDTVATDSLNKGVDDALAQAVGGDRSKARTDLSAGSTKVNGVEFALFLGNALVDGATMFDRKHARDPLKLKMLCGEADETVKAALTLLKESPDKDKEASVKKLQDRIKATGKNL
jgi:hypothetical protein